MSGGKFVEDMIEEAHGWNPDRPRFSEADRAASKSCFWASALNEFAIEVERNAVAHGFRPEGIYDDREAVAVFVANEHGEISELWEAYRNGLLHEPCDKAKRLEEMGLPILSCAAEELADVIIRALDTSRALGVDIGKAVAAKHAYNVQRPFQHGGKKA